MTKNIIAFCLYENDIPNVLGAFFGKSARSMCMFAVKYINVSEIDP